jgi:riboflavin kinase
MVIHLTEKGRKELVRVSQGLEVAFAPPEDEIIIEGQVVEGLGEGAYYVNMYASRFQESLGFAPYSGTLNVRVTDENSNKAVNRMRQTTPLIVKGFSHESRTFGDVICYRIKVNQAVEGVIVIAQRTHHSQNILEVIAPINLRKKLRLCRGDNVTLTVVPLHLVT